MGGDPSICRIVQVNTKIVLDTGAPENEQETLWKFPRVCSNVAPEASQVQHHSQIRKMWNLSSDIVPHLLWSTNLVMLLLPLLISFNQERVEDGLETDKIKDY